MPAYASDSIKRLRARKGYQEKKSLGTREQMESLHWNPGYANLTIDWIWFNDLVGWTCQGQPWCFGCQVVNDARTYGLQKTLELLDCKTLPVNCQEFVDSHWNDNRLNDTPEVGAYVFFHNGTKWCHVGKVTGVYKSYITSIEGNTSGVYDKVVPDGGAIVEKEHKFSTTKMIFWHPRYDKEETVKISEEYDIKTGVDGIRITCGLNYRDRPYDGKILGVFCTGQVAFPTKKCFVYTDTSATAWYFDPKRGWFSARHATGWIQESCGRWWWLKNDYKCDYSTTFKVRYNTYYADNTGYIVQSAWVDIDGKWYYFKESGDMAMNCYVKSKTSDKYYWVGPNGAWDSNSDTLRPPELYEKIE